MERQTKSEVVELSSRTLLFGECKVYETKDIVLSLKNTSSKPLDWEFIPGTYYKVLPRKGITPAMSVHNITVTYNPLALGKHDRTLILKHSSGSGTISLPCYGTAPAMGLKSKTTVRGLEALPKDFQREPNLATPDNLHIPKEHVINTLTRLKVEHHRENETYFSLSPRGKQDARENVKRANEAIRINHPAEKKPLPTETDLGLSRKLASPRLNAREIQKDPLWLNKSPEITSTDGGGVSGKKLQHDENNLVKKPAFKLVPDVVVELRDCQMELSHQEQAFIASLPATMDFGEISVGSKVTRSIAVLNDLPQFIAVKVKVDEHQGWIEAFPASQVIPSSKTALFNISLVAKTVGDVKRIVEYVINGRYLRSVTVVARVNPVIVNVSSEMLSVEFPPDSLDDVCTDYLTLSNPGNGPAELTCACADISGCFTVDQRSGTIEAGGTLKLAVSFKPPTSRGGLIEGLLNINVRDGQGKSVRLSSFSESPQCGLNTKNVDFGVVAVGVMHEQAFTISNAGLTPAVFHLCDVPDGLYVQPLRGRLNGESSIDIIIKCLYDTASELVKAPINIELRGAPVMQLAVSAKAIEPDLQIHEESFSFGEVILGSLLSLPLHITNRSPVETSLFMNLAFFPDFTVTRVSMDSGATLLPISHSRFSRETAVHASHTALPPLAQDDVAEDPPRYYSIEMDSGATISLMLTFAPNQAKDLRFDLPVFLPGGIRLNSGLSRKVTAKGTVPRLLLSQAAIDFKTRVVAVNSTPAATEIKLFVPEGGNPIRWFLDTAQLQGKLAKSLICEPTSGVVHADNAMLLRITYNPIEAGTLLLNLPLHISPETAISLPEVTDTDDYLGRKMDRLTAMEALVPAVDMDRTYVQLRVYGKSMVPVIEVDKAEVLFPVVKLNHKASALLHITNKGYEQGHIRHILPAESSVLPIFINYPEGQAISASWSVIPVEISFESNKPLSVACKISFWVDGGQDNFSVSVRVCATADNSTLTLWGANEEKPSTSFFLRWLNANVLRSNIESFPDDCITQQGRHLIDAVEVLTGKAVPGSIFKKGAMLTATAKLPQLLDQYSALLKMLISHGALLSAVKAEHFLSFENFLKNEEAQARAAGKEPPMSVDVLKTFTMVSHRAWLSTFLQVVKLFVVNRVTPAAYKKMMQNNSTTKGISGDLVELADSKSIGDSGSHSAAEGVLLRWLHFHYVRVNGHVRYGDRRFDNLATCLRDLLPLATLLESHVPHAVGVKSFTYPAETLKDRQANAEKLLWALKDIECPISMTANELSEDVLNARDIVLLVHYLYENIPHYAPKATVLFATLLGDNMTRHVDIVNPSKRPVVYHVRFDGSPDFISPLKMLQIQGGGKAEIPIEFISRFTASAECLLTLTCKRDGGVYASPMVLDLQSRCTGKKMLKKLSVSSVLYTPTTLTFEVTNIYSREAEFMVSISQSGPYDSFYSSGNKLKLKANETVKYTIQYTPFELAEVQGHIGFYDARVGEFYYELIGAATAPQPCCDTQLIKIKADEVKRIDVAIPYRNSQVDSACKGIDPKVRRCPINYPAQLAYDVKCSSKFFELPTKLIVTKDTSNAPLPIVFKPKDPGDYSATVVLTSKFDIRVIKIVATALTPNSHVYLQMETYARKKLVQDLPIVNGTDTDWRLQCILSGETQYFTCVKDATIRAMSTTNIELVFNPHWVCQMKCDLVINNLSTGETYEYHVTGIAGEPLAEDTISLTCRARESMTYKFPVRNYMLQRVTVKPETGLTHVFGPESVTLEPNELGTYEMSFNPIHAKAETGSVTFRNLENGQFSWFVVNVTSTPPKAEGSLNLACEVRQGVAVDVTLVNPLNVPVTFSVQLRGEGLTGSSELTIRPRSSASYQLIYSPMKPISHLEGALIFVSEELGQIWYELIMSAEMPKPEVLPIMECELGQTSKQTVRLENPIPTELILKPRSSNKVNFKVVQANVKVGPLEATEFEIEFMPSSLRKEQSAMISLEHPAVGSWAMVRARSLRRWRKCYRKGLCWY